MLSIDGSYGEGGGQLVRTALALAAITGTPVRIEDIRARRDKPGLRAQHLTAVRAVADVCGAAIEGAQLGSRALVFEPMMPPQPGRYHWEVGTAGAVSLVFQTVLWPLAFAGEVNAPVASDITLVGGTHVEWSPPMDYVQQIYLPLLGDLVVPRSSSPTSQGQLEHEEALVVQPPIASVTVERWGWYPRGGGLIRATIRSGVRLCPLTLLERGSLRGVSVLSAVSNLPGHIRQRQADRADFLLRKRGIKARIEMAAPPSPGQGTAVFILAEFQHVRAGFTSYGRLHKPAERVAEEACKAFFRYQKRGQPADAHLADQLLLPLTFACPSAGLKQTRYAVESVTQHLLTQAWVIQQFLPQVRIEIDGKEREPGMVTIEPCI